MALSGIQRSRVMWWSFTLVFAGAPIYVVCSFIGAFVLRLFIYYVMRPIY